MALTFVVDGFRSLFQDSNTKTAVTLLDILISNFSFKKGFSFCYEFPEKILPNSRFYKICILTYCKKLLIQRIFML